MNARRDATRHAGFLATLLGVFCILCCPSAPWRAAACSRPKEQEEKPLEGEARKQYDKDRKKYGARLKRIRETADLLDYLEKLAQIGSRAARDAMIRFTARSKDSEVLTAAFYHLVATKDPVAIRFVCGTDGILSNREETQMRASHGLARAKSPAIAGPILDVLENPRMNIDIKSGLLGTIAEYGRHDNRVLEALLRYGTGAEHQTRTVALEWMGQTRNKRATALLVSVIKKSSRSKDRKHAWIGLGDTKRWDLLPELRKIAKSERQSAVREEAEKSIKAIEARHERAKKRAAKRAAEKADK